MTECLKTNREVEMIDNGDGTLKCPACGVVVDEETLDEITRREDGKSG